jgi:alpha-L-fucosidase 2
MKSLLSLIVPLACSVAFAATARAQDKNFHVFLCLGQSNMEGYPGLPDEEKTGVDPRFEVLAAVDFPELGRKQGQWYPAVPPLCRPGNGLSPADYFGRTLVARLPADQRVGVVSVAVAGARLEVFDNAAVGAYAAKAAPWMQAIIAGYGGSPYDRLVALAREAQKRGVIRGILLHQGESNNTEKTWPAEVKALYTRLLADLHLDAADVPLLVGELANADQQGGCAAMNPIIDALPQTIPTAHVVSSAGCPVHDDHVHFLPEGYRTLGRRYAEVMLPLLAATTASSAH